VTTPGNRAFVERMAKALHTVRPEALSQNPQAPTLETFEGKRVFQDAANTLELYDVGPNPHAKEILVAYLPKEQLLFVADLFSVPSEGPLPPGTAANKAFAQKLAKLALTVSQIAPGHGRLGTLADLTAVLATTPRPDVAAE